jgi:hypothetical protein
MDSNILSTFNQIKKINYDVIVEEKSFLSFRFIKIPNNTYIEKRSNLLFINNYKYNIDDLSISEVFDLILSHVEELEILYFTKDIDFISYTNSLFLQDFSTKKFIKTDIIFSPLNMELFQEHIDDFNSEFILSNTKVFNTFKPIPFNIENNILSINDKSQYNYMVNEYQAKELNISLLQEFPINNVSDVYMYNYQSYLKEDLYDF